MLALLLDASGRAYTWTRGRGGCVGIRCRAPFASPPAHSSCYWREPRDEGMVRERGCGSFGSGLLVCIGIVHGPHEKKEGRNKQGRYHCSESILYEQRSAMPVIRLTRSKMAFRWTMPVKKRGGGINAWLLVPSTMNTIAWCNHTRGALSDDL